VQKPNVIELEPLARAYVSGEVPWNAVHDYAIEMEWSGVNDFPAILRDPLEALHAAFLTADERDDPQFRADKEEVASLLAKLGKAWANRGSN
jgi:hypothetical protein